jgi:site-specific recombinase XerD
LFISRLNRRLSTRQVRHQFALWQERAGFTRRYTAHCLRHSALTNLYRQTKDVRLTQRFARHKSIVTSMRYTHPDEAELVRAVQQLHC